MAKTVKNRLNFNRISVSLILFFVLVISYNLRNYSYSSVPLPGETDDEYSFGWLGISLIRDKYPIAWSGISGYKNHDYQRINVDNLFGISPNRPLFSIDKPWFDHPPLFGLLVGGYAYAKGIRNFEDASVAILRRPMVKLGVLSVLLVFFLGYELYGFWTGLLSAALCSVIPGIVITSRLALAENGYIPLVLCSLIFALLYIDKRKSFYWIISIFLSSVALLFKLSAIFLPISLILISVLYGKKDRFYMVKTTVLSVVVALGIFVIYGAYFDWNTFKSIFLSNSNRFYGAGAEIFRNAIMYSTITGGKSLTDGWILLGWLAFFALSISSWKKDFGTTILTIVVLSYTAIFLIFGSEGYGWYRYPFYPFLIISAAKVFRDKIQSPNLLLFYSMMLLPVGTSLHRLVGIEGFQKYVSDFRLLTLVILSIFSLDLMFNGNNKLKFIQRFLILSLLVFAIWLSIKEVYFYNIDKWYFAT